MGTNSYITKLKAQIDRAITQRDHWKQLAENRNSIVVTEVCPESRSVNPGQHGEAVEVVAWQGAENPLYTTAERRVMHGWANNQYPIVELMTVAQHQRITAALAAEVEWLREHLEVAKSDELNAAVWAETEAIRHELWDAQRELAAAPAHPAERQEQGEVQRLREAPVVVATAILGGLFHGGSGPELGEIDIEVCTPALEAIQCETVDSSDDVFLPLMTVAQHNRIVAALSAQQSAPERVSVPVELLQDLHDLASDAVEHHRAAFAGYKLKRQANMEDVVDKARAILASHGRGAA